MKPLKRAIDIQQQIKTLEDKGIVVDDVDYATQILSRINYYRILGYVLPFKEKLKHGEKVKFKKIVRVLMFDQRLRNLMLKYIEHVEISLRTFIVRCLAFKENGDGMAYRNPAFYRNRERFEKWLSDIDGTAAQSDEPFIVHHRREYDGQYPIWVMLEVVSIGKLSRMYELLNKDIQVSIAGCYNKIHPKRLSGYLKSVSYLRNKCAHHSRIYYRVFNKVPMPNAWYDEKGLSSERFTNKRLMSQLYMLKDLCVDENIWGAFLKELSQLIDFYKEDINIWHIGLNNDWKDRLNSACK